MDKETSQINAAGTGLSESAYIRGLDSIRFVCALWVMFFHGNLPPLLAGMDRSSLTGWVVRTIYAGFFNGPAAVIVFFLISGFCIHFPQRHGLPLAVGTFYMRRGVRIGLPWLAASVIGIPFGIGLGAFTAGVGWSLIAESIYYVAYPALLVARRRFGWRAILVAAYFCALLVFMSNRQEPLYMTPSPALTALLGLPCWLLGCVLAERFAAPSRLKILDRSGIRLWRFGIWTFSGVILSARYGGLVSDQWTLSLFAIPAYFWLRREIAHFQTNGASRLFEWMGKWSYSIYLAHLVGSAAFSHFHLADLGYLLNWGIKIVFMLAFCYAFHLVFEWPSHWLARRIRAARKSAALTTPPQPGLLIPHPLKQ